MATTATSVLRAKIASAISVGVVVRAATSTIAVAAMSHVPSATTMCVNPVSINVPSAARAFARAASMKTKGVQAVNNKMTKMKAPPMTTRARRRTTESPPTLRFTPTAWTKLLFLRDYAESEVGGFGICPQEPLLVEDICLVKQSCHYTSVVFEDESVANFFDEQVDRGLQPDQFARVWIHTHPGDCPQPSLTDEGTFDRVFGKSDWAVMFILACGGEWYTRLRFNSGPAAELLLETEIEFETDFPGTDPAAWEREYLTNVEFNDPFDSGLTTRSDRKSRQRVAERAGERVTDWDVERDAELVADLEAEQFEDAYLEMLTEREEAWSHDYS